MQVYIPKEVTVVELESAPFKNAREALKWAKSHGIIGVMSDVDTTQVVDNFPLGVLREPFRCWLCACGCFHDTILPCPGAFVNWH